MVLNSGAAGFSHLYQNEDGSYDAICASKDSVKCDFLYANVVVSKKMKPSAKYWPKKYNFLIGEDGEMTLIDWEYSGQGDTAQDLGSFIACSDMSLEEALKAINMYLGHEATKEEQRHYLAYTAIASYCWYLWAIYQEANSVDTGDFLKLWHDYSYLYLKEAIVLYEE